MLFGDRNPIQHGLAASAIQREEALEVYYGRVPRTHRGAAVQAALEQHRNGDLDLSGLFSSRRGNRTTAAIMTQVVGNSTVVIWPPVYSKWMMSEGEAVGLIRHALRHWSALGIRVAQGLVGGSRRAAACSLLEQAGLPRVTELLCLRRSTREPFRIDPNGENSLIWRDFESTTEGTAELAGVLRETYVGSRDVPELDRLRPAEEMIEGYRSARGFDPRRWRLVGLRGEPRSIGVVLLGEGSQPGDWRVTYLGLAPEGRGKGLGRHLVAEALRLSRPHVQRLELAVDARNAPARKLYSACGFRLVERREVHLAALGGENEA